MRFIGDVHQKYKHLYSILNNNDGPFIQVGDLGFAYPDIFEYYDDFHFIGGNHDNWDVLTYAPPKSYLGRFGYCELYKPFFYVSGAFSIDHDARIISEYKDGVKSFWPNEQLSWKEGVDMLDLYGTIKPEVMVTHTVPREVSRLIGNPNALKAFGYDPDTFTTSQQELLQQAFEIHQPKVWVAGHFHMNRTVKLNGTTFRVLEELEVVDYDEI